MFSRKRRFERSLLIQLSITLNCASLYPLTTVNGTIKGRTRFRLVMFGLLWRISSDKRRVMISFSVFCCHETGGSR
jgi:hypothetical protein